MCPRAASLPLLQLRPRLPGVPAFLKLRLSFLQGRHAVRSSHRTVDGHRPEKRRLSKAGWVELEGHYNYTVNRVIFVTLQTFCGTALVPNQIFVLCRKSTTDGGCLHEITGRQTFDCSRRPQDECEPGGRVLEGAEGDCRQAAYDFVDAC